ALDRHDFLGAARLLHKVLTSYPDPSIARTDLLLRLAVASAHMGDRQTAEQALTQFAAASGPRPSLEIVDAIVADVKSAAAFSASDSGDSGRDWRLALGNPSRTGH